MRADPESALKMAQKAEKLLLDLPGPGGARTAIAETQWLQGAAYLRLNDATKAAPLIERGIAALKKRPGPSKLKGDLLMSRGELETVRADVSGALNDFQTAHNIFRELGETRSQAVALQQIASLYREAGDFETAIKYDTQSSEIYRGDPGLDISSYNNRGNALRQMKRPIDAEAAYRKALAVARQLQSPLLEARILGNIARGQLESDRIDAADKTIAEGLRIAESSEARGWRPQLLAIAAQAALQRGNLRRAADLISRSFAGVDLETTSLAYSEAHGTAYATFSKLGNTELALAHLKALKRLDDNKASLAASVNTALMAARFDYANQDLKIAKLKADELQRTVAFERARAEQQRLLFLGIAGATVIGVSMLLFGLVTIRRSRNQVRAANRDLAGTNVALEKALAAKTEFLATTSHEIRTPLNGILGMTQVMLADRGLPDATRDRLSVVHGAGVTMRALVDDILDVAKMETGNLTLENVPMDVCATLHEVSRLWEEQARARGIVFALELDDCPAVIEGDPARLRQIVFNLLSNALKFTEKGAVTIRVEAIGTDRLRIAVSDTGIGIPRDKQEEIFESFKQVDAGTTRKFGGTGLGLSICRNLARAMGGDIEVTSVPGEGSTFAVMLPLKIVDPAVSADSDLAGAAPGMLIVDRNPISRSMLRALVESRAGTVNFASTVAEVVDSLAEAPARIVLIDDATLRATGALTAALSAIVAARPATTCLVLMLAATADSEEQEVLATIENLRIVTKPIAGPALLDLLYPATNGDQAKTADSLVSRAA
ncbi:MAG: hypothetical protein B7Y45_04605 [Sphingomonas sp. 28-66-16]|nr:MAG: hypothetical protein B7Y45_04605 [Sphingomonas sp. 28-66-16]